MSICAKAHIISMLVFLPAKRGRMPEKENMMNGFFDEFVKVANEGGYDLCGVAANVHGKYIGQYRWAPDEPHQLYSASKSYTSIAVGMAVGEGLLSVSDKVISFFPDKLPDEVSPELAAMSVRDLLTMASGHAKPVMEWPAGQGPEDDADWVRFFLAAKLDRAPGQSFVYESACTFMLSAIIQKLTGAKLLDYLMPRLFTPLGLERPVWDENPQGINLGGTGLHLRTADMLPFGQLLLQRGMWNGRRLVSADWIDEATSFQISTAGLFPGVPDKEMGYGYQFWLGRNGIYRASGMRAQGCVVIPHLDAVVTYNAGNGNMQGILDDIWDNLCPKLAQM